MKAAVEHLEETFAFSERRACDLIGLAPSTFRYQAIQKDDVLRSRLVELAHERPRFGYRRLQVLLRREGIEVNHKRVWRVYQESGLSVKRKNRKRLKLAPPEPVRQLAAAQPVETIARTNLCVQVPVGGQSADPRVLRVIRPGPRP